MTEQLQFVFDSGDWQFIIPFKNQKKYLQIEAWCTETELKAFDSADDINREHAREAVLTKRTNLLTCFQTYGLMV